MTSAHVEERGRPAPDAVYELHQKFTLKRPETKNCYETCVLWDDSLPISLITYAAAESLQLVPEKIVRDYVDPKGRKGTSEKCYTVAISDLSRTITETVRAWLVERLPHYPLVPAPERLRLRFPTCKVSADRYRLEAMHVEIVLARDQLRLHPRKISGSRVPGDNLSLYTSRFELRDLLRGVAVPIPRDLVEQLSQPPFARRPSSNYSDRSSNGSAAYSTRSDDSRDSSRSTPGRRRRPSSSRGSEADSGISLPVTSSSSERSTRRRSRSPRTRSPEASKLSREKALAQAREDRLASEAREAAASVQANKVIVKAKTLLKNAKST
jgi:hypothetical protein